MLEYNFLLGGCYNDTLLHTSLLENTDKILPPLAMSLSLAPLLSLLSFTKHLKSTLSVYYFLSSSMKLFSNKGLFWKAEGRY